MRLISPEHCIFGPEGCTSSRTLKTMSWNCFLEIIVGSCKLPKLWTPASSQQFSEGTRPLSPSSLAAKSTQASGHDHSSIKMFWTGCRKREVASGRDHSAPSVFWEIFLLNTSAVLHQLLFIVYLHLKQTHPACGPVVRLLPPLHHHSLTFSLLFAELFPNVWASAETHPALFCCHAFAAVWVEGVLAIFVVLTCVGPSVMCSLKHG